MFSTVRIAPSILSANFMDMERDIRMLEEAGADIIHVDVMDGHFVPNLTIGVPFIKQLRAITDLPIDVHLMISNPQEQIDWYLDLDPDYVSVHIEAVPDEDELHTLLRHIRERGASSGAHAQARYAHRGARSFHRRGRYDPGHERIPGLFGAVLHRRK